MEIMAVESLVKTVAKDFTDLMEEISNQKDILHQNITSLP